MKGNPGEQIITKSWAEIVKRVKFNGEIKQSKCWKYSFNVAVRPPVIVVKSPSERRGSTPAAVEGDLVSQQRAEPDASASLGRAPPRQQEWGKNRKQARGKANIKRCITQSTDLWENPASCLVSGWPHGTTHRAGQLTEGERKRNLSAASPPAPPSTSCLSWVETHLTPDCAKQPFRVAAAARLRTWVLSGARSQSCGASSQLRLEQLRLFPGEVPSRPCKGAALTLEESARGSRWEGSCVCAGSPLSKQQRTQEAAEAAQICRGKAEEDSRGQAWQCGKSTVWSQIAQA